MSYGPYEERAEVYLMQLLQKVKDFQFYTENGVSGKVIFSMASKPINIWWIRTGSQSY